jgi:hypothetical protein
LRWLAAQAAKRAGTATGNSGPPAGFRSLFRPPILQRTLLGISLGAVPVVGTAANANWVVPWTDQVAARNALSVDQAAAGSSRAVAKNDPRSKARTLITRSSGAIIGSLIGGAAAAALGRRLTYFLISLITWAVSTWLFTQLTPDGPWFREATFLLGLFGVMYFGWLPLFLPELFPTEVRAAGSGISFNSGRLIAAAVVVYVGLRMSDFQGDYATIGFWSGLIYVVGMLVIWLAPREPASTMKAAQ